MWADIRIPALLDTPAAVRFVSAEPLLGPIDLIGELCEKCDADVEAPECNTCYRQWWIRPGRANPIDWVIVGGESGPGARPMHPDWARSLRDQCQQSGTAFFYKQWGEFAPESAAARVADDGSPRGDLIFVNPEGAMWSAKWDNLIPRGAERMRRIGKRRAGRELDGRTWDEFPVPETASESTISHGQLLSRAGSGSDR